MKRNHDILCYFQICAAMTTASVTQIPSLDWWIYNGKQRTRKVFFWKMQVLYL